jgi:branched-chain amino acid transport system substrate-binding protein
MNRRTLLATTIAAGLIAGAAQAQETLTIGAVAPKTGPLAGGAAVTYWPNVQLWAHDVNEAGGLQVGDTAFMIEVIEYDDQTNPSETIRAVQRLATQDEADFILPPYSTGLNLAAAPIYNRYDMPMITSSATTDQADEISSQFPNVFISLGGASGMAQGAVDVLSALRERGDIGDTVAMVNVADAFGIELAEATRPLLEEAGFELVYDNSYPLGTQDLTPVIRGVAAAEPDTFLAWSYPPDTFGLTEQAIIADLQVGAFLTGVGTAFPSYAARFGAAAEGVLGIGGVHADGEAFREYAARHEEVTGVAPDYWASAMVYSTFQALGQAIEGAGTLDRAEVTQYIRDNSFDTVIGPLEFDANNNNPAFWTIGQWQGGVFKGVASTGREGAVEVEVKSGWE